jgi:hypothetical protein
MEWKSWPRESGTDLAECQIVEPCREPSDLGVREFVLIVQSANGWYEIRL